MTESELFYTLALLRVDGVGDIIAKKLIREFDNPELVFKQKKSVLTKIEGIGLKLYSSLQNKSIFELAEQELKFIQKNDIEVSFFTEKNYPERLKHCIDGPTLLFSKGAIDLENKKIISVVGTRQITSYGTDFCKKFIEEIAPLNPIIVSGFAYGVDILIHQLAIENNLQTLGVLAHGLNQVYPKTHKKFVSKMEQNGGFLTEFWSIHNPDKENFVRRNRIVAGISEATIVVESADRGGSLITATLAADYNRDVFAVPGRVSDKYSMGCNTLIKTQRAQMLTSAADLVYMLNWEIENQSSKPIQKQLFVTLEEDEQKIYDYLLQEGKQELDLIALKCDFPIFKTSSLLTTMELKGVVRPLPGKIFEAI